MPRRWVSHLLLLTAWIAAATALGLWFGALSWWLAGALAAWLAATLYHLYDLDRVLDGRPARSITATSGLWAELLAHVERHRRKAGDRKRKYHRLLREVRTSTGALRDAGVILNRDNEIQWFNASATTLLGFDARRDIGQRIDNLVRHPEFVAHLDATGGEIMIPSPRDGVGRLAVQVIPYSRNQRLAIFRDVTREHQLERTRRDFVANASHELRSPLTVLSGYLDAMSDESDARALWRKPLDEMRQQCARMTSLVQDLLELSLLESTDEPAPRNFVDVTPLLRRLCADLCAKLPQRALETTLDDSVGLLGDETQLHSVFFNLLDNAARFTSDDGMIEVRWGAEPNGMAYFSVRDNGIGIPQEQITRVTERFYRVDPGRSRASGGTGLGLAIVKHVLQKHGATLTIESALGKGSRFVCQFPADRVVSRGGLQQAAVK